MDSNDRPTNRPSVFSSQAGLASIRYGAFLTQDATAFIDDAEEED